MLVASGGFPRSHHAWRMKECSLLVDDGGSLWICEDGIEVDETGGVKKDMLIRLV